MLASRTARATAPDERDRWRDAQGPRANHERRRSFAKRARFAVGCMSTHPQTARGYPRATQELRGMRRTPPQPVSSAA